MLTQFLLVEPLTRLSIKRHLLKEDIINKIHSSLHSVFCIVILLLHYVVWIWIDCDCLWIKSKDTLIVGDILSWIKTYINSGRIYFSFILSLHLGKYSEIFHLLNNCYHFVSNLHNIYVCNSIHCYYMTETYVYIIDVITTHTPKLFWDVFLLPNNFTFINYLIHFPI